jgi:hypothetical protein
LDSGGGGATSELEKYSDLLMDSYLTQIKV